MKTLFCLFISFNVLAADVPIVVQDECYIKTVAEKASLKALIEAFYGSINLDNVRSFSCDAKECKLRSLVSSTSKAYNTLAVADSTTEKPKLVSAVGTSASYIVKSAPSLRAKGAKETAIATYLAARHAKVLPQFMDSLNVTNCVESCGGPARAVIESKIDYLSVCSEDEYAVKELKNEILRRAENTEAVAEAIK